MLRSWEHTGCDLAGYAKILGTYCDLAGYAKILGTYCDLAGYAKILGIYWVGLVGYARSWEHTGCYFAGYNTLLSHLMSYFMQELKGSGKVLLT